MGSTIVAVLVEGDAYTVGHAGDSRVYLLRHGAIEPLTEDHSLVMEQLRRGLITAEQAQHSEVQNIITRALGTERNVQADIRDMMAEPGDTLLLVSDGLTRHLSDLEILRIASSASSSKEACAQLVAAARDAGGLDNITCLILRFEEKAQKSSEKSWLRKLIGGEPSRE
jgi:protein phosphatase